MRATSLLLTLALSRSPLATTAEETSYIRTGRYEEVVRLCTAYQLAYPGKARCLRFGATPEGRPLLALVASADGALDPKTARERGRPVVFFQGGIHAGEIDGKDAGLQLLRDLLDGKAQRGLLSKVTAVFVPVVNVDGHERFGPNHRPNQLGPAEMGWRVTSQNLNLNRDYMKAEAPEMRALLRLLGEWDPIVYVDLHVTDGAKFEHDIAVIVSPVEVGNEKLREAGLGLRTALVERLEAKKHLPLPFYPSFLKADDPSSGFAVEIAPPRFSTRYWSLRNRLGILVETHSWKDYAQRVRATYDAVLAVLSLAARDGSSWLEAARVADEQGAALGGRELPVAWGNTEKSSPLKFRGFHYRREPSAISGQLWTRYDESLPQLWEVPLFAELKVASSAQVPKGGYLIPSAHVSWMAEKLAVHGVAFELLRAPRAGLPVEVFRATDVKFREVSYESRQTVRLSGAWTKETCDVGAGWLYVPTAQSRAELVVNLFDPAAPDSWVAWGFFNAAFEAKEYMESYVAEDVAREMLEKNPKLASEFEKRLAEDASFARDPAARLDFFYRRHPSYDDRYRLYPVLRVAARP